MTPALRTPWPSVFFIYACGVGAGMQFAKTSVVYDALAKYYAAGPALAGWFVSAVGIVGVLFGATAGLIVARIGARPALLGALFAGAAISLVEATLPPVPVFLGLRGIEGAAHLAIVVAAPSLMTRLAAPRVRPLALGLWGTFMSVAFLIGGAAAGKIVEEAGLGGVFLTHAALMAALAVAALFVAPRTERPPPMRFAARALVNQHIEVYANTNTATPAWCFLCYTGMYVALQTLTPELAPENQRHALIVGMALVSVVATLVAGGLAARGASPFLLTAGAFVATLIASAIVFIAVGHEAWFAPAAIFRMAFLSLLPGAILPMIPRLNADAPAQARAFGAIAQTGNIGSALGPPIFASSAAALGPVGLFLPAAALCVVGAALAVSAGRRLSHRRP